MAFPNASILDRGSGSSVLEMIGRTPLVRLHRFEQETRAFFTRVHEGYLAIAKREPGRVAVVDARGTPGQTHQRIVELVRRKLKL